jgi:solute carrier family 25 aspartate/glutamate transporter 12/13
MPIKVPEKVAEALSSAEEPPQLSVKSKARFTSSAVKDAETGELYLGPDEFMAAIAPPDGDYVSPLGFA